MKDWIYYDDATPWQKRNAVAWITRLGPDGLQIVTKIRVLEKQEG